MRYLKVEQTARLQGCIAIPGSKNSSLSLLAASCLADEPVTLQGIPNLADFQVISEIAEEIGLQITRDSAGFVTIDPGRIQHAVIDPKKSSMFRTAYYFVGALLAKFGKVSVGYPGGDDFVSRPIDQHYKALQMMGAKLTLHPDYYEVEARELKGATIYFDTISSGATINSLLAAVRAKGRTVLHNAARDPEVTDTANFLIQMGARITGAGTDTIQVEGVPYLHACTHTVIPDRLVAGAFLMAAGITGGAITLRNVIPEHLRSCMAKLTEIGLSFDIQDDAITAHLDGNIKAARIRTAMYPGFATDLQQPLTSLLLKAPGKSIIHEKIFPHRFHHVQQLKRMGADIDVRSGIAFIKGGHTLRGTLVHASDIRAGISLILAGMMAEGCTTITGVQHIERGYEDVVHSFTSLGAKITLHDSTHDHDGRELCDAK
ncbi:UDP-N-acetylglucosamine 1-carboxyvinyltransferase [Paenibacillus sp. J2TS4]|uniref:UDP-N-acetylglucosamine 1-carboxyvinyltransferase n=1 Tax=Paenibacillus sp. J2TS4 TaxID=2807194 RepID=UPI001B170978|nr:UDP-N-acetylglucosamine 1-carboxyvinyltransferase [Paenibacillus sp. J2TS4]GIP35388.1 UDP-N-acetylglucosamine 1-carboxyvinyltransferase 2 [Paenibacillus sp. J2TS4]